MLTSKLLTEITENYPEFYVCTKSCKKFVSNWSW